MSRPTVSARSCASPEPSLSSPSACRATPCPRPPGRAPATQARLRDVIEILGRVRPWAGGSPQQAFAWYRSQPLPSLGDQTAEALVKGALRRSSVTSTGSPSAATHDGVEAHGHGPPRPQPAPGPLRPPPAEAPRATADASTLVACQRSTPRAGWRRPGLGHHVGVSRSEITGSPGCSFGTRNCPTQARNVAPFIAPLSAKGAPAFNRLRLLSLMWTSGDRGREL